MKRELLWLRLIAKRLLKNPLFILTLALIPVMVLGIRFSMGTGDAALQVAVYVPANGDTATQELADTLFSTPGTAIHFYRVPSEKELRQDVTQGKSACGYLLPENLKYQLKQFHTSSTPVVLAVHRSDEKRTKLIDEMVFSGIYKFLSFHILTDFIQKKTGEDFSPELHTLFEHYNGRQAFFEFEYEDGSSNKTLENRDMNYMLLPVRGMTAVLLLLCGMVGTLFWYEDMQKGLFIWLPEKAKRRTALLYLTAPVLLAGIPGILSLYLTGISTNLFQEIAALLLYLFAIAAFCNLLRVILPRMELMLAAIPVLTAGSLIVCPVFANLASVWPVFRYIQKLTPVFYYLNSIYSTSAKLFLFLFGLILLAVSLCISRLRAHRGDYIF